MDQKPFISVIIKTLNESAGIEKTIDSIREQLENYPHKIIVADSLSTDNTQQLAMNKGATVVSLVDPSDRCCGVGHQLGYLYSEGKYLLLMDGDQELKDGFIDKGVAFLEAEPEYAGVAGTVDMDDAANYEFKSRKQRINKIFPVGDCDHLASGGLYRRSAIEKIGYLTNRSLHAYEEAELGLRLVYAGFKLHRLDTPYHHHTPHSMSTFKLLKRRWNSRYYQASGELLRSAWGKPYFISTIKMVRNELIFLLYLIALMIATVTFNIDIFDVAILPLLVFVLLKTIQHRSLISGLQSVINLVALSAGLVKGLTYPVRDPFIPPNSKVIHN